MRNSAQLNARKKAANAHKGKTVPINTALINVTPTLAAHWLELNTQNRNLRQDRVNEYANQIKAGQFMTTHQGIAFYDDGTLADGQHRLSAIVTANIPVKMLVTQGLPRLTSQVIDQNTPRLAHDAIRISGGGDWITSNVVAVVRFVLSNMGTDTHPKPIQEIAAYANKYRNELEWINQTVNRKRKKYISHAGLAATYFCAIRAGVPRSTITRFYEIMVTGEINGAYENAAIRLREFLIATPGAWIGSTRSETVKRVQRSLHAFAAGTPLAKLYATDKLTYPIPA